MTITGVRATVFLLLWVLMYFVGLSATDDNLVNKFYIARGTKLVLPVDVFSFQNLPNVSDQDVIFSFNGNCNLCTHHGEPAGDINLHLFSLHELKQGLVEFNHYYSAGLDTVVLNLTVSINAIINQSLIVFAEPYDAIISLTVQTEPFVKEGGIVLIDQHNLNSTAIFQNQTPSFTYTLLTQPHYGILEMLNVSDTWVPLSDSSGINSFDQFDVDSQRIRYRQTVPILQQLNDSILIQVHSDQLPGPIQTLNVFIIPYSLFVKPFLTYNSTIISVDEGGIVKINKSAFCVSLSPSHFEVYGQKYSINFSDVMLMINITKPPAHGKLLFMNSSNVISYHHYINEGLTYLHDDSDTISDQIGLLLTPVSLLNLQVPINLPDIKSNITISIQIHGVNDNIPKLNQYQLLSPVEGSFIVVTTSMFDISDADADLTDHFIMVDTELGHFADINQHLDVKLTQFWMSQIQNREILFVFQMLNSSMLMYNETVNVSDGVHFITQELQVSILPLFISASVNLPVNATCLFTINTMHQDYAFLSKDMFNIFMNQSERLSEVIVEVVALPLLGVLSTKDGENVVLFSFSDIKQNNIKYTLSNSTLQHFNDSFALRFKLGHGQSDIVYVPVCIKPLPYPILTRKESLTVSINGYVAITNNDLYTNETSEHKPSDILYQIVRPPLFGLFANSSAHLSSLSSFTQADINSERIRYVHNIMEGLSAANYTDSFQFTVRNSYYMLKETYTVTIKIEFASLNVINTGFSITEGQRHIINVKEFFAEAPPGYAVTIYITQHPKEGDLVLRRDPPVPLLHNPTSMKVSDIVNGDVEYIHNIESEEMDDIVWFLIVAHNANTGHYLTFNGEINITVEMINDNPPLLAFRSSSSLLEYSKTYITTSTLRFSDADKGFDSDNLKYILQWNFLVGELCVRNVCAKGIPFEWYQRDMHGDLYYKHTGHEVKQVLVDIIIFSVSDGKYETTKYLYKIDINETSGTYNGNGILVVDENSDVHITNATLHYLVNAVVSPFDIVYKITSFPQNGFIVNSTNKIPVLIFTQYDINKNNIMYQQNGNDVLSDSFDISVEVHSFKSTERINVVIRPVDDNFPVLTISSQPMFVNRGSVAHINTSMLSIQDDDTSDNKKLLYYSVHASAGKVEKRFSTISTTYTEVTNFSQYDVLMENVRYSHNDVSVWLDNITLYIADSTNFLTKEHQLPVVIVPDHVTVTSYGLTVKEGGTATINISSIVVEHPYFAESDGRVSIVDSVKHGKLIVRGSECISPCDFQMEDIKKGYVRYVHNGSETTTDEFRFVVQWTNLPRTNLVAYLINIEPINDQSPRIINNTQLNIYAHQTVKLSSHYLYTSDVDTPPELLQYRFDITPVQKVDGYFLVHGIVTDNFTQADINNGIVYFIDKHTYDGFLVRFNFSVSDGNHKVFGEFVIEPTVVALQLLSSEPTLINVNMGEAIVIGSSILHAITNIQGESPPSSIFYFIDPYQGQEHGSIIDSNTNTTLQSFSQTNVTARQILYKHTSVDEWAATDYVHLTVFHPLALHNLSVFLFVNIHLPTTQNSSLAVKKEVKLQENGEVCLSQYLLDGRNVRYFTWKHLNNSIGLFNLSLIYLIVNQPQHGLLYKKPNETVSMFYQSEVDQICYRNDGSENDHDSFLFQLIIKSLKGEILNETSESMSISITLYNDESPQLVPSLSLNKTVVQGFRVCISAMDLNVTDYDNLPKDIEYTIIEFPKKGQLIIENGEDTFSQDDVNNCKVTYSSSIVGSTHFSFKFGDGEHTSPKYSFYIDVVRLELNVIYLKALKYIQSQSGGIINATILDTYTNGDRRDTNFTVVGGLQFGKLIVSGETRYWFTQSEVDHNVVTYQQTNKFRHHDQINLTASNSQITTAQFTIPINVILQGEAHDVILKPHLSQPLPSSVLDLSSIHTAKPPRIELTSSLLYGYLSIKYPFREVSKTPITSFRYDELHSQMIYYTWKFAMLTKYGDKANVTENITGLVWVDGLAPGEFQLVLTVQPPNDTTTPQTPLTTTYSVANSPTNTPATNEGDGFQYAIYIPVLGLILVIIALLLIMTVFCCSQFRNIRLQYKAKSTNIPMSPSGRKFTSPIYSSRPPHFSPSLNVGDINNEYSDSESSSAADIMMVQSTQNQTHPMTTISASHTHIPYSQEYLSSGYHSNEGPSSTEPFCDEVGLFQQQKHYASSVSVHSQLYSPHKKDQFMRSGSDIRSNSPVRRVTDLHCNTRSHVSLARGSTGGRSSPVKGYHDFSVATPVNFSRPESSSSIGYDSSSMTQDSNRPPSALISVEKSCEENQNVSMTYRTTHPVLKAPQYWV